ECRRPQFLLGRAGLLELPPAPKACAQAQWRACVRSSMRSIFVRSLLARPRARFDSAVARAGWLSALARPALVLVLSMLAARALAQPVVREARIESARGVAL